MTREERGQQILDAYPYLVWSDDLHSIADVINLILDREGY